MLGSPVVVEEAVNLRAQLEKNVHGRMVYKDLRDPWDTWVNIPGVPVEEVRVSRTVLPSSSTEILVRDINLASCPVTLRHGMVFGELEQAIIVEGGPTAMTSRYRPYLRK